MSMSRKDFEAIAEVLARQADDTVTERMGKRSDYDQGEEIMRRVLAREIAKVCAAANPAFDTERFLAAAKVPAPSPAREDAGIRIMEAKARRRGA